MFFDQRHVPYPATNMQYQAMIEKTCETTIISAPETLNSTEQRWKLKILDKVFVNDRYPKMEPPASSIRDPDWSPTWRLPAITPWKGHE